MLYLPLLDICVKIFILPQIDQTTLRINNNNNNNLFEFLKQKKAFIMKFIGIILTIKYSTKWGNMKYGEQGLDSLA